MSEAWVPTPDCRAANRAAAHAPEADGSTMAVSCGSFASWCTHIGHLHQRRIGNLDSCCPQGNWVMECVRDYHDLLRMWMALPSQVGSLQERHGVNCDSLAVDVLGIGRGWQQSKHTWVLLTVLGC